MSSQRSIPPFIQALNNSLNLKTIGALLRGDILFSFALITIVIMLVLPLPRFMLDFGLALSLAFGLMILMTVLAISRAIDFSAFPTVLLVATMLRLALNVASTRLILSCGHEGLHAAGDMIQAFGSFVMGGNAVIGVVVFSILIIINFVVITKGSGRIAEVAARFSLDALPGKQMAIDADLSTGLIDQTNAKERRLELQQETNFYGAMDGAAKFVRGDAIAGVLITLINVIGGILIGMMQQGLSFSSAWRTYTFLTVGDGLVTQIPALIISVAAGMLVSKTDNQSSAEKQLFQQLSAYPTALGMCAVLLLIFGFLPGMPLFSFMILSCGIGYLSWSMSSVAVDNRAVPKNDTTSNDAINSAQNDDADENKSFKSYLTVDPIRVEIGYRLRYLAARDDAKMMRNIRNIRQEIASEMGVIIPQIRLLDNPGLEGNEYQIHIKNILYGKGQIKPYSLLSIQPNGYDDTVYGEKVHEPISHMPAKWIASDYKTISEKKGYITIDGSVLIATHLSHVIQMNLIDLYSFVDTQLLIDQCEKAHQKLYNDMVPSQISSSVVHRILQNLLREHMPIKDLGMIIEGISDGLGLTKNPVWLTEHVRSYMARATSGRLMNSEGKIPLIVLGESWEKLFLTSLSGEGEVKNLALSPSHIQQFMQVIQNAYAPYQYQDLMPALFTSSMIRYYVRLVIERFLPRLMVIGQNEISPQASLNVLDTISE